MSLHRAFPLLVVLTAVLPGCGSDDKQMASKPAKSESGCIILVNGNKLCGDDAEAYCDRFVNEETADATSNIVCTNLSGADSSSDPDTYTPEQAAGGKARSDAEEAAKAQDKAATMDIRSAVEGVLGAGTVETIEDETAERTRPHQPHHQEAQRGRDRPALRGL